MVLDTSGKNDLVPTVSGPIEGRDNSSIVTDPRGCQAHQLLLTPSPSCHLAGYGTVAGELGVRVGDCEAAV